MIKIIEGDLLAVERGFMVQGCNAHGYGGAGIIMQFRKHYPESYEVYRKSNLTIGHISTCPVNVDKTKWVVNAITQQSTGIGKQVSYDAIESCFERIVNFHAYVEADTGINLPICFPMIGAGLGGGSWPIIEKIIDETVPNSIEKHLYIFKG
jgi:O-acetyl-ADP-ribose deacetylase (regulator of RNase III)